VDPFHKLARGLHEASVRFVLIGVWGANYWAHEAGVIFTTRDRDLFLPPDPDNLLRAWQACQAADLDLLSGDGPLDMPRDDWLARKVVERRALTRATDGAQLDVDLTLVMAGFDFETVWQERRVFTVDGVGVPTARLLHIVQSKAQAGRPKDHLFLETHKENLRQILGEEGN
jgi:hypothetical protein